MNIGIYRLILREIPKGARIRQPHRRSKIISELEFRQVLLIGVHGTGAEENARRSIWEGVRNTAKDGKAFNEGEGRLCRNIRELQRLTEGCHVVVGQPE